MAVVFAESDTYGRDSNTTVVVGFTALVDDEHLRDLGPASTIVYDYGAVSL